MNVVHVYDGHEMVHGGRGSVPDVVWSLARLTADRGHDVTVVERRWDGLAAAAEHDGVAFRRLSLRTGSTEPWAQIPYELVSTPVGAARLLVDRTNFAVGAWRVLRTVDSDVVHVHLPFAANVLAAAAPRLRRRMVYTAHLGETRRRVTEPRFSPDVFLARRAARTVALNPGIRTAFVERGVPPDRLEVIPNGVDVDRFEHVDASARERVRRAYGISGESVVLFVGTLTPRKGADELVRAAVRVLEAGGTDVRFLLVGRTDLEPEYVEGIERRVRDAGAEAAVTLAGFVPESELVALYSLADLFVLPSFEEGSSIAVTEAMAAEVPVVASTIDGVTQQIAHGTHGLLVEPGDVEGLAEGIARLLDRPDERRAMRSALAERKRSLSWDCVADEMLDVYRTVAAG